MKRRMFAVFTLMILCLTLLAPVAAFAAADQQPNINSVDNTIYSGTGGDNAINGTVTKVISIVGGIGAGLFTLAVMCIAIAIIFGSLSPQKAGTYWKALLLCAGGAFIFFGAYKFAATIATLAQSS